MNILILVYYYYLACFGIFFGKIVNHGLRISLQEGFSYVEGDNIFPWKYPVT